MVQGNLSRHLSVISAVEVCACPELLLSFIRWLGRKIRSDSTFYYGNAKLGDKIWESGDIKIPVYCDNNTNGNFVRVSMFMPG